MYNEDVRDNLRLSNSVFTTEPKTRKHFKTSPYGISGNRLRDFMEVLFRKKLKTCSYNTARFEFVQFFETNDPRVIEKYLGRPASKHHSSTEEIIRMDRMNGKVARMEYSKTQRLQAKKGLIEELCYATLKDGVFVFHHEKLSYFTRQVSLEGVNHLLESKKSDVVDSSIDDLCVCSSGVESQQKTRCLNTDDGITTREEREESTAHTHKCVSPQEITVGSTVLQLSPEETAILHAKPAPEPNRAKIDWGSQPSDIISQTEDQEAS